MAYLDRVRAGGDLHARYGGRPAFRHTVDKDLPLRSNVECQKCRLTGFHQALQRKSRADTESQYSDTREHDHSHAPASTCARCRIID